MAKPRKPNRHLPVGGEDSTRLVKFPVNPELSPRETCKAIDRVMQIVAYEVDLAKQIREAFARNPIRMIEVYLNRFPSPELKSVTGTELHIQVMNVGAQAQPVAGVLSSPIEAHVAPALKLVVNEAQVVETIEADK